MDDTYLSTHTGDVGRWAAELDAVPVREDDGYAIVDAGDVGLDQEKRHWDEFHAETDDEVVVRHEDDEGQVTLTVATRTVLLERMELSPAEREAIENALAAGETVSVSADASAIEAATAAAAGGTEPDAGGATSENELDTEDVASETETATGESAERRSQPQERDVGKPVVAADGHEVGMVTSLDDTTIYVDPHPGLTESALATLGWSSVDDEDVPVDAASIEYVTTTAVRLSADADSEDFDA